MSSGKEYYTNRRQVLMTKVAALRKPYAGSLRPVLVTPGPAPVPTLNIACMASFPDRKVGMVKHAKELLPQVSKLCIYMNGYDTPPKELTSLPYAERLELVMAGPNSDNPDIMSHGKFHWLDKYSEHVLFMVDDDIYYPKNYVEKLRESVEKYGRKAVITMHGSTYRLTPDGQIPPDGLDKDHKSYIPYDRALKCDTALHIPGNGVSAYCPKALGMTRGIMMDGVGTGDDGSVGLFCQTRGIPVIRIASTARWIKPDPEVYPIGAQHLRLDCLQLQNDKHRAYAGPWRLFKPEGIK